MARKQFPNLILLNLRREIQIGRYLRTTVY